jgi:hypothetical protein
MKANLLRDTAFVRGIQLLNRHNKEFSDTFLIGNPWAWYT